MICTEIWFMERARAYGKNGAHLIATPTVEIDLGKAERAKDTYPQYVPA